jgi:general secretion pathway protein D
VKTLLTLCSLAGILLVASPGLQAQTGDAPPVPPPPPVRRARNTNVVTVPANVAPAIPVPSQAQPAIPAALPVAPAPGTPPGPTPAPLPAGATNAIFPANNSLANLGADETLPENTLTRMQGMPLDQFLSVYALVTDRIVLRPYALPNTPITLDASQKKLTKSEALHAMDTVLELNGITMINVGDKFVTAVTSQQALQEGAAFTDADVVDLPEAGQFITKVVQLKYALPTEVMPLISSFSKLQGGVVPIDSSQTLVLRDYAANIKRMMEIIEKVDVQIESDYKLEVIPIKYGKVEDIYATMGSLIGGGGGFGGVGATGARQTARSTGSTGRGAGYGGSRTGVGQTLGMNPQANATGLNQNRPGQLPGQTGNAFNNRLQQVVSGIAGQGQNQMLRDAKIVPDERSNSLIVFASKEDLRMITNVVEKVDRQMAQVLVEVLILSVTLNDDLSYGVQAYLQDQSGNMASKGFMNSGSGALTNALSNGGLAFLGTYNNNMSVLVQALSTKSKVEVLATPRIQTSHAVQASFSVGSTVPYVTGSSASGLYGGAYTSFSQLDVNTTINVTPFITPDGLVVMDIDQQINDLTGFKNFPGVGDMPTTSTRSATSTVSVQDGDTIMLGGYIRTTHSVSKNGVPILQDIPGVGALFRSTSKNKDRDELVIFIRPTILLTPRDAAILAGKERQRMPGVREMEKDMKADELARQKHADHVTGADKQKNIQEDK